MADGQPLPEGLTLSQALRINSLLVGGVCVNCKQILCSTMAVGLRHAEDRLEAVVTWLAWEGWVTWGRHLLCGECWYVWRDAAIAEANAAVTEEGRNAHLANVTSLTEAKRMMQERTHPTIEQVRPRS